MTHYRYLIIGGGLTGDAAVRGIREFDEEGFIGMISMEPDPPYARPSLSKGLWKGRPIEKIWDSVPAARSLLTEPGPFKSVELISRLKIGG
jgi:hypothetical protein